MSLNESLAYRYQETATKTATPLQLVVMLYDTAIHSLQNAQNDLKQKNVEGRTHSLNHCVSVLSELQSSLNIKEGGEIAGSLNRLYDYMKRRLFQANVALDLKALEEVAGLLENLRSAWKAVVEKSPKEVQYATDPKDYNTSLTGANNSSTMPVKPINISI